MSASYAAAVLLDDFSISQEVIYSGGPGVPVYQVVDSQVWDPSLPWGGRHIRAFAYPEGIDSSVTDYSLSAGIADGVFRVEYVSVPGAAAGITYPDFGFGDMVDLRNSGTYDSFVIRMRMQGVASGAINVTLKLPGTSYGVGERIIFSDPTNSLNYNLDYAELLSDTTFTDVVIPFVDFSQWGLSDPYTATQGLLFAVRAFKPDGGFNTGSIEISDIFLRGPTPVSEPATVALTVLSLGGLWAARRRRLLLRAREA